MTMRSEPSKTSAALRPMGIIVAVVVLVGLAIWQIGPRPISTTNPYLEDLPQTTTGAGSHPDGAAVLATDGVVVDRDEGDLITGGANATDLTGIAEPGFDNTVEDESGRTVVPSDVITRDEGSVSDATGTVKAPEGS